MTETPPPSSPPPPGWYPDPTAGSGYRWWNGFAWTERVSSSDSGSGSGLGPVGDWLGETFRLLTGRAGHIFTLIVVLTLPPTFLTLIAVWVTFRDIKITNLDDADLIDIEGFNTGGLVVLAVAAIVSILTNLLLVGAVARQTQLARQGHDETWSESFLGASRRLPRMFGNALLVWLIFSLGWIVVIVGSALFPLLFIITIPVLLVATVWAFVRFSFVTTAAAVAPSGVGAISSSLRLTKGNWWPLCGRLLLLTGLYLGIQLSASFITAPLSLIGGGPTLEPGDTELVFEDFLGPNIAAAAAGQVISGLTMGAAWAVVAGGQLLLYRNLGGDVSDELDADPTPA